MKETIQNIFDVCMSLLFYGWLSVGGGAVDTYQFIRKEVFITHSKGLPSLSKFTRLMTCVRYDKNLREIPITTGTCKR